MKILVVGDAYMPPRYFRTAFAELETVHQVEYVQIDERRPFTPGTASELRLREFLRTPGEPVEHMGDVDVLVVQGAPVTDAVLDASSTLKLVCCARGGPVNIDVEAVAARGLLLASTPGKNAEAVADLTLAFLVMLPRGLPAAQRFLDQGNELKDNWEGARFIGLDLRRHTIGLVGYGQVGTRVAARVLSFGASVLAYDPYVTVDPRAGVEQVATLDELLARSDFVSLHARATAENSDLVDAEAFAKMKQGALFVN